uniref:Transcription initiation factor IIE subunit alpha N-terminal domain-containing protein n=1 Tax=Leersia perrieri TaxID=77586 RepID=A0A0D9XWN8_9ORYZ
MWPPGGVGPVYDVVRYRINRMRKKLKDELDDRDTIQHYICPNCKRRYSAFDALQLLSYRDDCFHCEHCNRELLESEEFVGDNAKKHSHDKLKDMQKRMEQLKTLIELLDRVKDISFPYFGSLQHWERATINTSTNDAFGSSLNSVTPMPFLGGLEVSVQLERQLGAKSKRDDSVESDDDRIKLKVKQPTGNIGEVYKLDDLNMETQQSSNDNDGIEWQEG